MRTPPYATALCVLALGCAACQSLPKHPADNASDPGVGAAASTESRGTAAGGSDASTAGTAAAAGDDAATPAKSEADALPPCMPAPKTRATLHPRVKPPLKILAAESAPAVDPAARAASDAVIRRTESPVASILGKKIQGLDGDDLGRVVDVLSDADGRVRFAIIEFGGFLGVGDRRIAVDWHLLKFRPDDPDTAATLSVSKTKLQRAPEYRDSHRPFSLMAPESAAAPLLAPADGKK